VPSAKPAMIHQKRHGAYARDGKALKVSEFAEKLMKLAAGGASRYGREFVWIHLAH
jgi:hypothetical protein